MVRARIGCSGWDYPAWRGPVYDPALPRRRWFERYASLFDTVELNATFYRLPDAATVARWEARAPEGFEYAVKMGRFGSHRKKLKDPETWLPTHIERLSLLGRSEGPTLVQLPPRWRRNAARLDEFLAATPAGRRWAVELRDPSWVHDETFGVLAAHGAALCIHDLLPDHPWELTTDWTYVRFHGPDAVRRPYQGGYPDAVLGAAAERMRAWLGAEVPVYAYFNNDEAGHAVADATRLRHLVGA